MYDCGKYEKSLETIFESRRTSYYGKKLLIYHPYWKKEEKLQQVVDYMEELKDQFSDLIQEYEDDGADVRKVDTLTEALDALEDAYEMVCEVAEEEE